MLRSFEFNIVERYARLSASLPEHTSIQTKWPRKELRAALPDYLSIATMTAFGPNITDASYLLMGTPVHVVENDVLSMSIMNNLQSTGLSIHFHGFEMINAIQYDGVVGLTQCAIPPQHKFEYNFKVEETEGLYWYHTHSGNLGVDSHNVIKGPLIVHPDTPESRRIVDDLNSIARKGSVGQIVNYDSLLSYGDERILFFSDGFLKSDITNEMYYVGGLNPPVQLNDDGFVAAALQYEFGTVNGKMREIIHVVKGETYKFRLLNGGSHFAYRISIDGCTMKVVAADSNPVTPYEVDDVILHNAERFDVEVQIPDTYISGDTYWIRADTIESHSHGYQNGIRAILHVVDEMDEVDVLDDNHILDPKDNIASDHTSKKDRTAINCYSNLKHEETTKTNKGVCLPITVLQSHETHNHHNDNARQLISAGVPTVVRTVDFDLNNPPLHAHFTRVENGNWYQHTLSSKSHVLRPDFEPGRDLHPHTAIMYVPSYAPVIIIWRSRSIMDQ